MNKTLEYLKAQARPMIDENGNPLPNTGITLCHLHINRINDLLSGGIDLYRDTGKRTVTNFTVDGKRYTLTVEITKRVNKNVTFTWDHRDDMSAVMAALTPSDLWEGAGEVIGPMEKSIVWGHVERYSTSTYSHHIEVSSYPSGDGRNYVCEMFWNNRCIDGSVASTRTEAIQSAIGKLQQTAYRMRFANYLMTDILTGQI